jgi:magnesium-transporting ATPase (P-type)
MMNAEILIWASLILFITFLVVAVYIYFQAYKFDEKYLKLIERVRKVKCRNFIALFKNIHEEDIGQQKKMQKGEKEDKKKRKGFGALRNLYILTQKGSSAHIWFDYPLMAKEFLIGAAFWLFMLGYAIIQVCLIIYFEYTYLNSYYSSYATFTWFFCCFEIYKYLSQYTTILKNIDRHLMLIRAGRLDEL